MKFCRKLIAGALMAVMCLLGLTGCGKDGARIIFTTGFGKNEVFRIDGEVCTKSELMVYLINTQNRYENVYGEEVWDISLDGVTLEQNVKETVLARIAQIKTMYLLAKEKNITLEADEQEKVKKAAEEYFSSLNEKERTVMGVSLEVIENLYREYALANKVYQEIIRDINPEISDDEARTITVQHIFMASAEVDGQGNLIPYSSEEKRAIREKMEETHSLAIGGENDFEELASRYSEDGNLTLSFGKGEMDPAFEKVAFELETNEISGIVETQSGYHIIKCLNTFDRTETDANKLEIVEERRREVFGQEYDAFVETLARELNEKVWQEITLTQDGAVTTSDFFEVYAKYFPE